jgi:quercetin dioxygenase-like cupin family protein
VADNWYVGNASDDAPAHRGWILGHFIGPDGAPVRASQALEIKWGEHPTGEERAGWTSGEDRSTLVLLVSGRFRIDLSVGSATLERQGDYITWGPGIEHSWQAEEDSVVLTVRWPSIPADS